MPSSRMMTNEVQSVSDHSLSGRDSKSAIAVSNNLGDAGTISVIGFARARLTKSEKVDLAAALDITAPNSSNMYSLVTILKS